MECLEIGKRAEVDKWTREVDTNRIVPRRNTTINRRYTAMWSKCYGLFDGDCLA